MLSLFSNVFTSSLVVGIQISHVHSDVTKNAGLVNQLTPSRNTFTSAQILSAIIGILWGKLTPPKKKVKMIALKSEEKFALHHFCVLKFTHWSGTVEPGLWKPG